MLAAFDVKCRHSRLQWMILILRRWGCLVDDYCQAHDNDVPYHYSERTNVGLLGAAAWAVGSGAGSVLEYACIRRSQDGRMAGWADLYLYDRTNSATIEAKQLYVRAGVGPAQVNKALILANGQAVTNRDSDTAVAAVFLTLKVAGSEAVEASCQSLVQAVVGSDAHAWAWAFPRSKQNFCDAERGSGRKFRWPGVVVGLRVAHGGYGQTR